MSTLTDLLQPKTQEAFEALLMSVLQAAPIQGVPDGFPVTDWQVGSFERTHMKMIAAGLADFQTTHQFLTASGFLELAATLTDGDGNPVEGWMELLAAQFYKVVRIDAGYTRQLLTLTCTAGPGPYTRGAGELIAYAPATGNRYVNVYSVTIPDGGSVTAIFQAEGPGVAYRDSVGSIVALTTPLPGVSVTNAPTAAGVPASYLTGSGAIAVTSTTITPTLRTVKLVFTAPGRASDNSAYFTCTVYQGATVTVTGPFAAAATFTQGDLTLGLTDGPAATTSFNAGDTWIVGLPGTPLLQAGTDKETLAALAQRCRDRWSELSPTPTANRFAAWVRECEAALHVGIAKVTTKPSDMVAGVEEIYIAGPTATATPAQVAAAQAYVDARAGLVDAGNVIAATAVPILLGGTVTCRRGTTASVQAAADLAWLQYIASLGIGGNAPGGLIALLDLQDVIHDAGAYTASGLTLNDTAADVVLTGSQCATIAPDPDGLPSLAMAWLEVA
jgi:hypothetical protein